MFNQKKEVSVIGQGFVGVPMSVLIANKTNYFVNGIEKNNNVGKKIKKKLDSGLLPFNSDDKELKNKFKNCINKNYKIFLDIDRIKNSEIIIMYMAVGHLQNSYVVANSPRRPISEVLTII